LNRLNMVNDGQDDLSAVPKELPQSKRPYLACVGVFVGRIDRDLGVDCVGRMGWHLYRLNIQTCQR